MSRRVEYQPQVLVNGVWIDSGTAVPNEQAAVARAKTSGYSGRVLKRTITVESQVVFNEAFGPNDRAQEVRRTQQR